MTGWGFLTFALVILWYAVCFGTAVYLVAFNNGSLWWIVLALVVSGGVTFSKGGE